MISRPLHTNRARLWLVVLTVAISGICGGNLIAQQAGPTPNPITPGGGGGGTGEWPVPPVLELIVDGSFSEFGAPTTLGSSAKQILHGNFTDDAELDVVLFDGTIAKLISGIDVFTVGWSSTVTARGVAAERQANGQDTLIGTTDLGLVRFTFESDASVTEQPLGFMTWLNATHLRIANVGGAEAELDLIGISPTGDVLVLLDYDSATPVDTSFTSTHPAFDLLTLDWDGVGPAEIALLTDDGLRVHAGSGSLLYDARSFHPQGVFASAPLPTGADGIAWVTPTPNGLLELLVLVGNGFAPIVKVFPTVTTGAIAMADLNDDGWPEIALRQGVNGDLLLLKGTQGGYLPDDPEYAQVIEGVAGDGNSGTPHFLDLEGDGDLDLLWNLAQGTRMRAIRSGVFDSGAQAPDVVWKFGDFENNGIPYFRFIFVNGEQHSDDYPHLQACLIRKADPATPADATVLQVKTLPFADTLPPPPLLPGNYAPFTMSHAMPTGPLAPGELIPEDFYGGVEETSPYPHWQFDIPETGLEFDAIYILVLRYVSLDAQGIVDSAGPSRVYYFTPEQFDDIGTGGSLDYILNLATWTVLLPTVEHVVPPVGTELELSSSGTYGGEKPGTGTDEDAKPDFGTSGP